MNKIAAKSINNTDECNSFYSDCSDKNKLFIQRRKIR